MILSLVVFLGLASALGGTSPAVLAATVTTPLDKTITKDWEYAVSFSDRIIFYDVDWQMVSQSNDGFHYSSIVYDEVGDQVYFADMRSKMNGSIYVMGRSANNPQQYTRLDNFVERMHESEQIRGLAFDPMERMLYWIDTNLRRIYKLDVRQPKALPIVLMTLEHEVPMALAVDVCRRQLYFTAAAENVTTIYRATLGGEKPTALVQTGLNEPIALEIDQLTERMFWVDDHAGTQVAVEAADLDGQNRKLIYEGAKRDFRSIIVDGDSLLVVDYPNDIVVRLNKTVTPTVTTVKEFPYAPRGIIKRTRFVESHDDHLVCAQAVSAVQEHHEERQEKEMDERRTASPITTDLRAVICINGEVNSVGNCKCADGWTGEHCQTKVCQNYCFHGTCGVSTTGYPFCHCETGFTGERCEINKCSGYCLNDGQCEMEDGEPVCHCPSTFSGRHCEMINSRPVICRAFCEMGMTLPNIDWSIEEECSCGNLTAAEPLCSIRSSNSLGPHFVYIILAAVLVTIVLIVVIVLGAIRRWYKPARPKIKKTYVVRKNVTPLTYRPAPPSERCEITIENCCNMEYCDTPCFDPKILVKDGSEKERVQSKEDKRDLLSNIVLDNNSDLF